MSGGYVKHAEEFNRCVKLLVTDLKDGCPTDADVYRVHKRVMTAISISPLLVVDLVGPYLLKYHKVIYASGTDPAGVEQFFMDSTFDSELNEGVDREKVDLVRMMLPKTKEYARVSSPAKKERYCALVVEMLDNYLAYADELAKTKKK